MNDVREFWRNQLRLTAKEIESRNLLCAIRMDLSLIKDSESHVDQYVRRGILACCSEEKPGTVVLNWVPLKRYLRRIGTDWAHDYIERIREIEEKLKARRYF